MLYISPTIVIEESELEESFVRASGPGGQNVNKVATAVQLRFDARRSPAIDDGVRHRLRSLAGKRMTAQCVLVIDARRHRTQAQNREDARNRLAELVRQAATPARRRRRTMPSRASKQQRLEAKARRGETKQRRAKLSADE